RISRPRFVAWFARTRNGVEPPGFLARCCVESGDEPADAIFRARYADNNLVFDYERSMRDRVPELGIANPDVPDRTARLGINRDEVRVDGAHEQCVAEDRYAPVHGAAARPRIGGRPVFV